MISLPSSERILTFSDEVKIVKSGLKDTSNCCHVVKVRPFLFEHWQLMCVTWAIKKQHNRLACFGFNSSAID